MDTTEALELNEDIEELLSSTSDGVGQTVYYKQLNLTGGSPTAYDNMYNERKGSKDFETLITISGYFIENVTPESIGNTGEESLNKASLIVSENCKAEKFNDLKVEDKFVVNSVTYRLFKEPTPLNISGFALLYILNLEEMDL